MYDVAIVGFGPAGAVAAGLLGQAGLKVHVCDRRQGVYEIPRAIALDHEIMRVFQRLGVVDEVQRFCEPFTPSEYFGADGQLIRRMTMVEPPYPQGYTPSIVFTQPPVERALRALVDRLGNVTVQENAECSALSQDADGVSLTIGGKPVRARWAIAADGGASALRGMLGIELEDLDFDEPWLVVDVVVNEQGLAKLPQTSVQYCEPERPCTYVIGPGNHRRWEISLQSGEDPRQMATPEETWKLLSRWITPQDGELWRQSSYRFHALVAQRWRAGRVFLAGDAAHMQPPFLGQGMCQGVRDVANLTWKLAAVARGEVQGAAAERLLGTYGAERKAHVTELTRRIKHVGEVICERDPHKARERDARLLAECGGIVKDTPRQDILPALTTGLLTPTAGAGTLFPQPRMRSGELMDQRFGSGWRLVTDGALPIEVPPGLRQIDMRSEPEAQGVVSSWMLRHGVHAAIVRPDHYTYGAASSAAEMAQLLTQWQQR